VTQLRLTLVATKGLKWEGEGPHCRPANIAMWETQHWEADFYVEGQSPGAKTAAPLSHPHTWYIIDDGEKKRCTATVPGGKKGYVSCHHKFGCMSEPGSAHIRLNYLRDAYLFISLLMMGHLLPQNVSMSCLQQSSNLL